MMNIGIIGSGNIGSALAGYLTNLGHQVMIANSRGPGSISELAAKTGAIPATTEQAAGAEDLVIIAIPEKAIPDLPISILAASRAIIVDAGNYYPSRDGRNTDIESGLTDSEWVAKVIGHPVIKAFNNIVAPSLASKAVVAGSADRIAISVAGNDEQEKQVVMDLIDQIGFDAIDAGLLSKSWRQQPGEPAYCRDLDKDALKSALADADISKRAANLAHADEMARPYL
ncbi:NAD(P)-binding domain-containing protein [Dyadobacter chenwenxiniae]|uniref:NAD(P)-binding domain-containing protein n=1 Tax=Dyadobacter chenwenxiniae TaxID=2906456 RepID=A0A9X1PHG0_9BACT|nr:NAD(P)-binding domain-containing protein [Dyadobacter chenwenxiniae]MCF0060721.1 NAD(P)-binding domain-containing protein [Dyadobacter chenwenxiniae]UON80555.1 NAD(P)-binding domain-containing protein [Dyadobacter chenwenxiniae]